MSRKRQDEDHFGSDSFLDVLANIVGILIILIVSAAARVQRGPEPPPAPVVAATEEAPPVLLPTPTVVEAEADPAEFTGEMQAVQQKLADLDGKSHAVVSLQTLVIHKKTTTFPSVPDEKRQIPI